MSFKDKIFDLIDKWSARNWTERDIDNYVSDYKSSYLGYAIDDNYRVNSASGGITTAILSYAIQSGSIDGALVCKTKIIDNKVRTRFYIAKTHEELMLSQGSKYVLTDFVKEALPLIKEFNGKLGIVALPCEISIIKKLSAKDELLKKKIKLTISLFCGHASDTGLIDGITNKLLKHYSIPLKNYVFRKGHWRGRLEAVLEDNTKVEKHAFYFNQFQNLYFFCSKKCLSCYDHFGYDADICTGDAWLYELKKNEIKHNTVIAKTGSGLDVIKKCISSGIIQFQSIDIEKVLDIQSRSVRLHYNVTSRSKAAKRYGIHIIDKVHVKTKWTDDILARLILFNFHRSNSKNAAAIFKLPKPIIKLYLYLFKILEII